jgi:hypothetical protein
MKKVFTITSFVLIATMFQVSVYAQRGMTITGTAVIYGSGFNTRTVTRPFTMTINRRTSEAEVAGYLDALQGGGQDALLRAIDKNDFGRFSLSGSVGEPLNAVIIDQDGDDTRIRAVFRRWVGFGELRRGARSVDYPFGYIEVRFDRRTGRGEGTFIPAARIRLRGGNTVEVEDFGTFPGRLMGVQMRGNIIS